MKINRRIIFHFQKTEKIVWPHCLSCGHTAETLAFFGHNMFDTWTGLRDQCTNRLSVSLYFLVIESGFQLSDEPNLLIALVLLYYAPWLVKKKNSRAIYSTNQM